MRGSNRIQVCRTGRKGLFGSPSFSVKEHANGIGGSGRTLLRWREGRQGRPLSHLNTSRRLDALFFFPFNALLPNSRCFWLLWVFLVSVPGVCSEGIHGPSSRILRTKEILNYPQRRLEKSGRKGNRGGRRRKSFKSNRECRVRMGGEKEKGGGLLL